jgi:integrase
MVGEVDLEPPMPKLTKRLVDNLHPHGVGKDLFYWEAGDGALKGFGIWLKPSGTGASIIQYRNAEGRTRRMVLVLTVEEARALARDRLTAASQGADPSADRHAVRNALTVGELCDLYLKSGEGGIRTSTLAMDRSRIETHVKPLIGRLTVRSLTAADVQRMMAQIIAGKTATPRAKSGRGGNATGGPGVAARTVGMLPTILQYAVNPLHLIKENPARGMKKPAYGKQRRFLTLDEIAKPGAIMHGPEGTDENPVALAVIMLLLLTGLRRMEALALPRAWVDTHARCIRFGANQERRATARHRRASRAPFGDLADAGGFTMGLFRASGRRATSLACRRCWRDLREGGEGVTVHVLRHSFAATAAGIGYSELTIAGLLGHSMPGVTARYAHVPDAALVSAADRIAAQIAAALDGIAEGENVVPMRVVS